MFYNNEVDKNVRPIHVTKAREIVKLKYEPPHKIIWKKKVVSTIYSSLDVLYYFFQMLSSH